MTGHRCILTQNQTRKIEIGKKLLTANPKNCLLCSHRGPGRRICISAVRLCCMAGMGYPPEHTLGSRALGYRRPSESDSRLENAPIQYRRVLIKQKCYHLTLRRSGMAIGGPETEGIWSPKCTSANEQIEVAPAVPNMVPACKTLSSSTHDPPK